MTPEGAKRESPEEARRHSRVASVAKFLVLLAAGAALITLLVFGTCVLLYAR